MLNISNRIKKMRVSEIGGRCRVNFFSLNRVKVARNSKVDPEVEIQKIIFLKLSQKNFSNCFKTFRPILFRDQKKPPSSRRRKTKSSGFLNYKNIFKATFSPWNHFFNLSQLETQNLGDQAVEQLLPQPGTDPVKNFKA